MKNHPYIITFVENHESMQTVNFDNAVSIQKRKNEKKTGTTGRNNDYYLKLANKINSFQILEPNWDSFGSEPISKESINSAHDLLNNLWHNNLLFPTFHVNIFPMRDGGIQFEIDSKGDSCEIEINPDGNFFFLTFDDNGTLKQNQNFNISEICEILSLYDR